MTPAAARDRTLSLGDVAAAAARLEGVSNRTPVLTSSTLDGAAGARTSLKAEQLQRSGSFKFRGAYNAVAGLTDAQRRRGLCTVSSGNHAQALALAGRLHGASVRVHMPHDANPAKLAATRGYGAEVVLFDRYSTDQSDISAMLIGEGTRTYVSAHDDLDVAAGAGTAALELFEEVGPLDVLVAPVSGGGGLSGYGTVARALAPGCRVIGVEPAASGVVGRSLRAGRRLVGPVPRTIADGQTLTSPGAVPFAIMRGVVDDVVVVTDAELVSAMLFLFERMKAVVEPSGASGLAALLAGKVGGAGGHVGVILSGGNVDAATLGRLVCQ